MIQMASDSHPSLRRGKGAWARMLDFFSSVWMGIALAAMLFIYCSIGSGVPQIRQSPLLEMTEFQWFHWWPFNALMVLFCVTLTIATIRRIPLRFINIGVLTIHSGIILMVVGSYYYFGTKVEGDAPVYRRQVRIELPGLVKPQTLPVLPGADAQVPAGPDVWKFSIQSTNTDWPILSDEHKGETAYAVNVAVTPPTGEPFVRQLLAGYEQYTEDVIPGKGRAIKSLGRKLVDEKLKLTLEYEPQDYFHIMDTWALFVRRVGATEWSQRVIDGLPRYHDHVAAREQVFVDEGTPLTLRALDLPVSPAQGAGDALGERSVRVTGYLRHAQLERRWRDGGDRLNPVIRVSMVSADAAVQSHELMAFDREHHALGNGLVQFLWLEDAAKVADLPKDARALLNIDVPESNIAQAVPIIDETVSGRDGAFTPLGDSGFAYRILGVQDRLALPNRATPVSIAMVEIRSPEGTFRRWVSDDDQLTRDLHGEGADPHAVESKAPDPRIRMRYQPSSAPLMIVGHPAGLRMVFNGAQGRALDKAVQPGESVEIVPGLAVRVDGLWKNAVPEVRPYIVPPERRDRKADESYAMIRVQVDTGRGVESRWLSYNAYALPNENYAYAGRFAYSPERFRLADGSTVEVMFSRERMKLPHPIALEEFELDTHLGGFTGSVSTIRNYVSRLRFLDNGKWSDTRTITVNNPTEYGGFWYFQSMWDRPQNQNPGGGMNYTGLGVGNRHGVYIQLAGCCFAVAGMIFAFYVKPVLKRRRAMSSRSKITGQYDKMESHEVVAQHPEAVEV